MDVRHEDMIREAPTELMLLLPFIMVVQVRRSEFGFLFSTDVMVVLVLVNLRRWWWRW
jgi:hypothetical protein